jgi:hypothetical protein
MRPHTTVLTSRRALGRSRAVGLGAACLAVAACLGVAACIPASLTLAPDGGVEDEHDAGDASSPTPDSGPSLDSTNGEAAPSDDASPDAGETGATETGVPPGDAPVDVPQASSYAVGGTVSGLAPGNSITLEDNGGDTLVVNMNGPFAFATRVPSGVSYSLGAASVVSQPGGTLAQTCYIANGQGTVGTTTVNDIQVTCPTSCLQTLGVFPAATSGDYVINPTGAPFQAQCDMAFDGGGWTLLQATKGLCCGPGNATAGPPVVSGSCTYLPIATAKALAALSTSVHVRSSSGASPPTTYITSATTTPITNLRSGYLLNQGESVDAGTDQAQWSVVGNPATMLDMATPVPIIDLWPDVYTTPGNPAGFVLAGSGSTWNSSLDGPCVNDALEVYVR